MEHRGDGKRKRWYENHLKADTLLYGAVSGERVVGEVRAVEEERAEERILRDVSSHVLAPALNGFVLWLLREASRAGIERLYFLARDGYLMYCAAQIYCAKLHLPIECRYLCCSRYSLRLPLFHLDTETALEYICRGGIDVTMEKILNRAGLEEEEQRQVMENLQKKNLPYGRSDAIPYAALGEIRGSLRRCRFFMERMCRHSREAFPALKAYMLQEGALDQTKASLVDSGWTGSMQKDLNRLFEALGREEPMEGYYWGLYELPGGVGRESYHCYFFTPEHGLREKVRFNNCLFEAVFSAPHGMTLGYEKVEEGTPAGNGGRCRPVYAPLDEKRKRFMEQTERWMLAYTERLAESLPSLETVDVRAQKKVIRKLLAQFMGTPGREEARVYGSLSFSDDVLEYGGQYIAAHLTEGELRENHFVNKVLVMSGVRRQPVKESAWYEGSAARDSRHPRRHLRQYRRYQYLRYIRKTWIWRKEHG